MTSILIIGATFKSSNELKQAIAQVAIGKHYKIDITKSNQTRYIVKYCNNDFKWRLHASQSELASSNEFVIKTLVSKHTCIGVEHLGN